jgi:hypothetical protein
MEVAVKRRKRWARAQLTELRESCARFHGTALRPYVAHLINISEQLPAKVKKYSDDFMSAVRAMKLDGALEHAGRNFALVYAGGCIAIEAKVLPWNKEHLFRAIESCFRTAADDIRGHTNSLGRARAILKAKLHSDEMVQARPGRIVSTEQCAGYWEEADGIRSYTVHAKVFRRWFASQAQAVAVLRWLYDQGDLLAEKGKLTPSLKTTQWAERSWRWPGFKVVKSIRLCDPFLSSKKGA